jgi:hypothetical protein
MSSRFFWWKDIIKLFPDFGSFAFYNPNIGNSALFWHDNWNQPCLKDLFPHLFFFTRKQKSSISFFLDSEVERIFSLSLLVQASEELENLKLIIDDRE